MRVHPGGLYRSHRRNVVKRVKDGACGKDGPHRRLHPGNTATFLIDEDRNIGAAAHLSQAVGQRPQLNAIHYVALEQYIARRLTFAEKGALMGGQFETGESKNYGLHRLPQSLRSMETRLGQLVHSHKRLCPILHQKLCKKGCNAHPPYSPIAHVSGHH
jgi:hypothetical protein